MGGRWSELSHLCRSLGQIQALLHSVVCQFRTRDRSVPFRPGLKAALCFLPWCQDDDYELHVLFYFSIKQPARSLIKITGLIHTVSD